MRTRTLKLLMILLSITAILSFLGCDKSEGEKGEKSLDTLLISVPDDISPVAIVGEDQTVVQGTVVTVDGSESFDEDGQIVSYRWELRDGTYLGGGVTLSTDLSLPVGTYEIVLIVTDDQGATGVDTVVITVVAAPPNPPAPEPEPQPEPAPPAAAPCCPNPPAPNPPAPAPEPEPEPEPAPNPPTPANKPPVADAGANQNNAVICTTVTLDGTGSSDPDGDSLTYQWTMETKPAGSTAALSSTTAEKPTFDADKEGDYTIELVVNDGTVNSTVSTVTVTAGIETGNCVTHNGTQYCEVVSPYTCDIWLDRNLGAAQVCTAYSDTGCYGDYYQWGRNFDGHEDSGSFTITEFAAAIDPVLPPACVGNFITNGASPYDWTASGVDDNGGLRSAKWSQTNGASVCPAGYRVPTIAELRAELLDVGSAEINGNTPSADKRENAFASFLKLPSAGYRGKSGTINYQGSWGYVWSSSASGSNAPRVHFDSGNADWYFDGRSYGFSVRCLRD